MEFPDIGNALGVDVVRLAEETRANALKAAELQQRLGDLVGRAESEDGRVRAAFSPTAGLPELVIDPRAMRLGSEELAEVIMAVVAEAVRDLDRQRLEAAQETFGPQYDPAVARPDPASLQETLRGMSETVDLAGRSLTEIMEGLKARLQP